MAPDEIRRLSEDKIIIIPERQFPIMAHRIKWYEDPTFAPMVKGQSGDLPYPQLSARDFFALRDEVQTLREITAQVVGHQAPSIAHAAIAREVAAEEPEADPSAAATDRPPVVEAMAAAEAAMAEVTMEVAVAIGEVTREEIAPGMPAPGTFAAYQARMKRL